MSPRNKTYVCFDAEKDTRYYDLMKDWEANASFPVQFDNDFMINKLLGIESDTAVKDLLKERLQNAKVLVIIIGKSHRNLYKYVRFEIDYALQNDIPIIGVYLDGQDIQNEIYFPKLKKQLVANIPFSLKALSDSLIASSEIEEVLKKTA
jgi:hypothetical protein